MSNGRVRSPATTARWIKRQDAVVYSPYRKSFNISAANCGRWTAGRWPWRRGAWRSPHRQPTVSAAVHPQLLVCRGDAGVVFGPAAVAAAIAGRCVGEGHRHAARHALQPGELRLAEPLDGRCRLAGGRADKLRILSLLDPAGVCRYTLCTL